MLLATVKAILPVVTKLKRQSASVIKVGMPCKCEAFETKLAYSVTVRISA